MSEKVNAPHSIIIEQREKISISGITEVVGFDDETVLLKTVMGTLTIKGERLHIGSFSTGSGDIDIDGKIIALGYSDDSGKGGFWRRLAK